MRHHQNPKLYNIIRHSRIKLSSVLPLFLILGVACHGAKGVYDWFGTPEEKRPEHKEAPFPCVCDYGIEKVDYEFYLDMSPTRSDRSMFVHDYEMICKLTEPCDDGTLILKPGTIHAIFGWDDVGFEFILMEEHLYNKSFYCIGPYTPGVIYLSRDHELTIGNETVILPELTKIWFFGNIINQIYTQGEMYIGGLHLYWGDIIDFNIEDSTIDSVSAYDRHIDVDITINGSLFPVHVEYASFKNNKIERLHVFPPVEFFNYVIDTEFIVYVKDNFELDYFTNGYYYQDLVFNGVEYPSGTKFRVDENNIVYAITD